MVTTRANRRNSQTMSRARANKNDVLRPGSAREEPLQVSLLRHGRCFVSSRGIAMRPAGAMPSPRDSHARTLATMTLGNAERRARTATETPPGSPGKNQPNKRVQATVMGFRAQRKDDTATTSGIVSGDQGHQPVRKRPTGQRLVQREREAEPQDEMADQARRPRRRRCS